MEETKDSTAASALRPLILVTNDDGIAARGIWHLVDCVKDLGEVWVVAPALPHSGQSSAITVDGILRVKRYYNYKDVTAMSVSGTPVDCVKLALNALLPRRPSLLLSGINHGSNSGNSVIYSGTMGAAVEGCMNGVPSVGFSLLDHSSAADFTPATDCVRNTVEKILASDTTYNLCLNINIPAKCAPAGIKVVKAARGYWEKEYNKFVDPHGNEFYMLAGKFVNSDAGDPETDEYWLERKYITVVPVLPDRSDMQGIPTVRELLCL